MMTNEESTEIVNFITPGTGALVLGLGNISHKVKTNFFLKSSSLPWGMIQTNLVHSNDEQGRTF